MTGVPEPKFGLPKFGPYQRQRRKVPSHPSPAVIHPPLTF
jgi:hypothetical protein